VSSADKGMFKSRKLLEAILVGSLDRWSSELSTTVELVALCLQMIGSTEPDFATY